MIKLFKLIAYWGIAVLVILEPVPKTAVLSLGGCPVALLTAKSGPANHTFPNPNAEATEYAPRRPHRSVFATFESQSIHCFRPTLKT